VSKQDRTDNGGWSVMTMLMNVMLVLLFGSYALCYCLLEIHGSCVSPMIQTSKWRDIDDDRLSQEYTYYERQCDASGLSAAYLHQLLSPATSTYDSNSNNKIAERMAGIKSIV